MKINATILFCLAVLTWCSSRGQDTNKPIEVWNQTEGIRHIDLKIDMPDGLGPVSMSDQVAMYVVQLPIGGASSFAKYSPPDASGLGLQVWLLKTNGTAVNQRTKPHIIGIGNAGWDTYYMIYTFDRVPSNELAGIVFQVKGKFYSREITSSMIGAATTPLNAVCGRWQSEQGETFEFVSDGTYERWQQTPPVSKSAEAEDADRSTRKKISKGRFLVNHYSLVLIPNDGSSNTNKYYVIKDRPDDDHRKFFTQGYSLVITQPDGTEKRYDLMYR
jgi:hypothetical protein